jgi:hypothetical protein
MVRNLQMSEGKNLPLVLLAKEKGYDVAAVL